LKQNKQEGMKKNKKFSLIYFWVISLLIVFSQWLFFPDRPASKKLSYREFLRAVDSGSISRLVIFPDRIVGEFAQEADSSEQALTLAPTAPWRIRIPAIEKQVARQFIVNRLPDMPDPDLLNRLKNSDIDFEGQFESNALRNFFLNWILPVIFFVLLWGFIFRRMGSGNPMLDLGKNKAKIVAESPEHQVMFSDVAGVDEAVEEVKEVVDFLKSPKKFTALGGKLPKGLLLVGPPGTGKTLLAKAVAGEARVPFFNLSGSDFVEMFVGVGAARVRDLFRQAKNMAPCIIFIDEIDAIGKSRGNNMTYGGGYDERENTLNQLLVEMDGFDAGAGVIIIGATNRPEVLDQALLRPGRFDRQVLVDRPDMQGREAIFRVHTRKLKLDPDVDLRKLAAQTPGFAGAEIANVCNEAAILAARNNRHEVTQQDFEAAIERIIAGLEKKNKLIHEKERKIVAYHEAGHAIVGYFTPGAERVHKVSIVPRGMGALGYTLQMPLEDRYLMTRSEILGKIKGLLGGRAAEEIVFNEISTGASNDLERVTQLVRNMIVVYGMSDKMPNVSLVNRSSPGFLGQTAGVERRSEHLEQMIDEETREIINACYLEVKDLLLGKKDLLEKMAAALLEKEVLGSRDIEGILSGKHTA